MAEPAAFAPDYIMPFLSGTYSQVTNGQIINLLWPTLYYFGTGRTGLGLNERMSLAYKPVYTNHDRTVTVTLKHYKWSDGVPVTSRDVTFFMNLLKANKDIWYAYFPGQFPDNVESYHASGRYSEVFNLNRSYNPTWFTDDQLSMIVPMPQHSWDKTSLDGKVGNYDESPSGARAVYNFLDDQGKKITTYDTNPLWKVVDGWWKLKSFTTNGSVSLVPNGQFSGPDKARTKQFNFMPFTTDTAEFNSLLAGKLTVGYVPLNDLGQLPRVKASNYSIVRSPNGGINYMSLNYDSPKVGPLVKQLYIRRVLNRVENQNVEVKSLLGNGEGGYVDYGPIPPQPPSPYEAPVQRTDEYPYSIATARKILKGHGWTIPASGPAVCERPGTGSADCGAGIPRGKRLEFQLLFESGVSWFTASMDAYKSWAGQAGIVLNLRSVPFNSVVAAICGTSQCDSPGWQIANWGGNGSAQFIGSPYPTTGATFLGHVGVDYHPTPEFLKLLEQTYVAPANSTVTAMRAYDTYLVRQAIVVWQPETYTLNAVSNSLKGADFYSSNAINPQDWYFSG